MIAATAPGGDARRPTIRTAAAAMTAVTIAVYLPALGAGFVGDDFMILHRLRALATRFFYYGPLAPVN